MIIERLFNMNRQDRTRIKRVFEWVFTFRDFPAGTYQTIECDDLIGECTSLYTKGAGEFYCEGKRLGDRLPGTLSTECPEDWNGKSFKTIFHVPTSRICIPAELNGGKLPPLRLHRLDEGQSYSTDAGDRFVVALGSICVNDRTFKQEQCFTTVNGAFVTALEQVLLLQVL